MALIGSSNQEKIWNYFKAKGLSEIGIAGLMGNLQAESGLNPMNMQNSYEKKLGLNDASYTAKVDDGSYTNFVKDKVGYGLAQWTFWSRKQNMFNFIKGKGKSIGDLEAQLDFLYEELTKQYRPVWTGLMEAKTVFEASNVVLLKFEKPANQGTTVQQNRAKLGEGWYNQFADKSTVIVPTNPQIASGNSPLVSYVKISPNKTSPRNHKIDTITIHCMAGNLTVERCGELFANPSRQASSNYGIGSDGRIALYVDEKDRSWCSSNGANDHRAITIEVANDGGAPDWHVSDKALASLIKLCADICKRNNIKKLMWQGDKSLIGQVDKQNMTVHRWFAAKACPGDYLYGRHSYIANEVNKLLGATTPITPTVPNKTVEAKPGLEVTLQSTPCYTQANINFSYGAKSGRYYLWDDKIVHGKIKITNSKANVGVAGKVTCWVNAVDLGIVAPSKPAAPEVKKLKAGDTLILENTPVYTNAKGTNPYSRRSGIFFAWEDEDNKTRIRVTNAKKRAGVAGQVSFWVDVKDVK